MEAEPNVMMSNLTPRQIVWLTGIIGFLVLSSLAIYASPMSAATLQTRLQDAAEDALYDVRADEWAEVEMNGQVAIVTGLAPDPEARDLALDAVSRAAWAGGVVAGGVTKVIDQTRVGSTAEAFQVRVDLTAGRIAIRGVVPDVAGRDRLEVIAERYFPSRVTMNVQMAPGSAPSRWELASRLMIGELARLDAGTALMETERFVVTGVAPDEQTVQSVRQTLATSVPGFSSVGMVRAPGARHETPVADARLCETVIRASLSPRPISFTPGTATLNDASHNSLRRAGDSFEQCQAGRLVIYVRAQPGDGGAVLAQERAEAVKAAMLSSTLTGEQIETRILDPEVEDDLVFQVLPMGSTQAPLAAATIDTNGE